MKEDVIVVALLVAGLIKALPVVGALGPRRLAALYGRPFDDPDGVVLMRHRALLFGLLGSLLAGAAFVPALRPAAFLAGLLSALSFIVLARHRRSAAMRRLVRADQVVTAVLLAALFAEYGPV